MELELAEKAWAHKKNSCKFSQLHARKHLSQIRISLLLLALHKEAKQNIVGVVGKVNAKLPHYTNLVLVYPMEN
jgi:hypothetical protein